MKITTQNIMRFVKRKVYKSITVIDILAVSFWWILMFLIWRRMIYYDGEFYWAGWINIWGDWTAHFPYIFNFLYRSFPLKFHPLFWGEPFRYHFAPDLVSAGLLKIGVNIVQATVIPSIIFSFLLVSSVYMFYLKLFKKSLVAVISSALFFFNGGLGFILFIKGAFQGNLTHYFNTYVRVFEFTRSDIAGMYWINFLSAEFIPQRSFLMGMPIAIGVLIYLWKVFNENFRKMSNRVLLILGLITGMLPLIHIYSYQVVMLVLVYLIGVSIFSRKKFITKWLWFMVPAIFIAFLQFVLILGGIPIRKDR